MKERPILMRGPLVVASLEDRKTQTRRIVKPQPSMPWRAWDGSAHHWQDGDERMRCPWGGVGDRLWARETFSIVPATAYRASTGVQQTINPCDPDDAVIYRAGWDRSDPGTRWRPSIHMPRWASRLTLEITGVRVERIRDITEADAIAEGVRPDGRAGVDPHKYAFKRLWDEMNLKRGYGWAIDPWVWVLTYRRIDQPPATLPT